MKTRKFNRHKVLDAKLEERNAKHNRHHLTNACRGGTKDSWNLIDLKMYKHEIWHKLFKNLSLEEVIALLQRLLHMKETERMNSIYGKENELC